MMISFFWSRRRSRRGLCWSARLANGLTRRPAGGGPAASSPCSSRRLDLDHPDCPGRPPGSPPAGEH